MRFVFLLVFLVGASGVAAGQPDSASTQPAADAAARAEQFLRDGQRLVRAGTYAEACKAFAASQYLAPALTTLADLADCREKNGQLASAWALFLQIEGATRDDRAQRALHVVAGRRATALEPRLSYLTVHVPDDHRVGGMVVTRDHALVTSDQWNLAFPVDGGTYQLVARAPEHVLWSTQITIAPERDRQSVDVPRLAVLLPPVVEPAPAPDERDDPEEVDEVGDATAGEAASWLTRRRAGALVAAGVAVAALGTSGGLELWARSTADRSARAPTFDQRLALYDDAVDRRRAAQIVAAAGAASAIAAVWLWTTGAPEDPRDTAAVVVAPSAGASEIGVAVTGRF